MLSMTIINHQRQCETKYDAADLGQQSVKTEKPLNCSVEN